MKTTITIINPAIALFVFGCLALSPIAQAVVPAPDGGYPGANTAEGQNALLSLTTGTYNTAVGIFSLRSLTTGNFNTAVGAGTLLLNTSDQNTATGFGALLSNTIGLSNTANGTLALFSDTTGSYNAANGSRALFSNTTGGFNTASGDDALFSNTTGTDNTAVGAAALFNNTVPGNTAIGSQALMNNTTGGTLGNNLGFDVGPNVAVGWQALESNTIASANTAVGYQALASYTEGLGNSDVGLCTAVGFQALANTNGSDDGYADSGFGYQALFNNISGYNNTAIGSYALGNNTSGSNNVGLGLSAGSSITSANNVICIGANVAGNNISNACYIGNIFGATSSGGAAVFVNMNGRLGTMTSSERFKEEIKPMGNASEAILALRPVSFRYKKEIDPQGIPQFGLVAEEVEKVNPDLVIRDSQGKPQTVRHDQVNAMLLNEFLKEHRKVEKLEAALEAVHAHLKEQDSKIQKISDEAQLSRPAPRMVLGSQ